MRLPRRPEDSGLLAMTGRREIATSPAKSGILTMKEEGSIITK